MEEIRSVAGIFIVFHNEYEFNRANKSSSDYYYNYINLPENIYPKYYKYYPSFDSHCSGDYGRITKEEFINCMKEEIDYLQKRITKINNLIGE